VRLDHELVRRKLAPSRSAARRAILEGRVQVVGVAVPRPATQVDASTSLDVDPTATQYVGRGGHKLAAVLDALDITVAGRRTLDVGAATGGFTDCLLQRQAKSVVALDVGTDQLHAELRRDPRVVSLEQTDVRSLDVGAVGGPFDLVVVDVSFVSVTLLADAIAGCVDASGDLVVLVKPQFEIGPSGRTKRGVVDDPAARDGAVDRVIAAFADRGFEVMGRMESPLPGSAGNREGLVCFRRASAATGGRPDGNHG
jgi:23S rRNA (cytidine1920-2'-O)/16S rRNA (cytidine1409-2'-O)-methyltransferase